MNETYPNINLYVLSNKQYKNKQINCKSDEDCIIECNQYESCSNSIINCPRNYPCIISCGYQSKSCLNLTINAFYSSNFELNDCDTGNPSTCKDITIYFPPMDYWSPRAYLNTGNNLNGNIKFYAVNGWLDIITSGYTGYDFSEINNGVIFCKQNYTEICPFTQTQCICNNPWLNHLKQTQSISTTSIISETPIPLS